MPPDTKPQDVIPLRDHIVRDLHTRVGRLEDNVRDARDVAHLQSTEMALVRKDVSYIKEGQDKLYAGANRILWAIAGSVIVAGTTFVLSGGLHSL